MATIADFNNLAQAQLGVPYVFGGVNLAGTTHPGLDCSGLPYAVALHLGQSIPRTSEAQFAGLPMPKVLRRGDLVFYDVPEDTQPQPAHVTIWWDNATVLQAPRTGLDVMFSPPLPYRIMGYGRLPFPDVAPTPPPPVPLPIKEETMGICQGANGKLYIEGASNGTAQSPANNLLLFEVTPGPPVVVNQVIDLTNMLKTEGDGEWKVQ